MTALVNREVLVLNKGWTAVAIISLEKAIGMLWSPLRNERGEIMRNAKGETIPKATIVDPSRDFQQFTWNDWSEIKARSGEDVIRTTNKSFRIPTVILLAKYDKLPMQKINFSRRTLFKRDNHTCQYCAKRISGEDMTMDHINPRSRGGKTTWDNVVVACWQCNAHKADRTPDECGMRLVTACEKCATITTNLEGKHNCRVCKAVRKFETCRPKKPILPICKKTAVKCEDWRHFLSEAYWQTELENDNK